MLTRGDYWCSSIVRGAAVAMTALVLLPSLARAEHEGKVQILLLGDSATEASIPRKIAPEEAQFEEVVRILLAAEGDLPPTNVINSGVSGEVIRRLLDSGRYDRAVARLPGLDYIFIRSITAASRWRRFRRSFARLPSPTWSSRKAGTRSSWSWTTASMSI